ncbi:hypothetical protein [Burkholderia sp. BCC0044]|nr:hypothetical protein [Burkholderia sp. BCC0044]
MGDDVVRALDGGVAGRDTTRSADDCFTGGDIDTLMRDVKIVALA